MSTAGPLDQALTRLVAAVRGAAARRGGWRRVGT
jgi:hypothetical protein